MEVIYSIFVPLFDYDYITVFSTVKSRVLKIYEQSYHILLTCPINEPTHMRREPNVHSAPAKNSPCVYVPPLCSKKDFCVFMGYTSKIIFGSTVSVGFGYLYP